MAKEELQAADESLTALLKEQERRRREESADAKRVEEIGSPKDGRCFFISDHFFSLMHFRSGRQRK